VREWLLASDFWFLAERQSTSALFGGKEDQQGNVNPAHEKGNVDILSGVSVFRCSGALAAWL